ncbi:MAG: hypothetical protein ACFB2X_24120 [Rivularia sp. (in: cyanobacteria)]
MTSFAALSLSANAYYQANTTTGNIFINTCAMETKIRNTWMQSCIKNHNPL